MQSRHQHRALTSLSYECPPCNDLAAASSGVKEISALSDGTYFPGGVRGGAGNAANVLRDLVIVFAHAGGTDISILLPISSRVENNTVTLRPRKANGLREYRFDLLFLQYK
ncbi:hypothetical protein DQ04_01581040 [Trypanosoma grayi]|uniref:hypothetical protein n=1 Tax=Trypanosoma grayi TaxID=71804 RepID=UPI0004F4ACC5|nr:hypothetical protein DQ04_01581040 [Trypanosoma grayi]KEG12607.1 hypothetical protein DQ04_01581040 [Trypanosoma grayi]